MNSQAYSALAPEANVSTSFTTWACLVYFLGLNRLYLSQYLVSSFSLNVPVDISMILTVVAPSARWRMFLVNLMYSFSFKIWLFNLLILGPEIILALPEIIYQNSSLNLWDCKDKLSPFLISRILTVQGLLSINLIKPPQGRLKSFSIFIVLDCN